MRYLSFEQFAAAVDEYTDCVQELKELSERLLFQNSFKLGARMIVEVMEEWTDISCIAHRSEMADGRLAFLIFT